MEETVTGHQITAQEEMSLAEESLDSRVVGLLNECKDAMTNPDYHDHGDAEILERIGWITKSSGQSCNRYLTTTIPLTRMVIEAGWTWV